ncbi:MAG: hypothetical protein NT028_15520 [candidate division Zixibacteria bacterium]|nr:hypothetical protein [candidate division Zixibacteria bacterium]
MKQKIVVPLLDCLGHNRDQLDFEYGSSGKRIDIFIKGLPRTSKVLIDTKNYDDPLDNHLDQIGLYAYQEGALLALIVNGDEIRVYNPSFRGFSFRESLLYAIERKALTCEDETEIMWNLLSRDALVGGSAREFIEQREREILEAYSQIESATAAGVNRRNVLLQQRNALSQQIEELKRRIETISLEVINVDRENERDLETIQRENRLGARRAEPMIPRSTVANTPDSILSQGAAQTTGVMEITLRTIDSNARYGLIPLPEEHRRQFPGYEIPFVLETDIGSLECHVTSDTGKPQKGHPTAGKRIQRNLIPWYKEHPELKDGAVLFIEILSHHKRYRLGIKRTEGARF